MTFLAEKIFPTNNEYCETFCIGLELEENYEIYSTKKYTNLAVLLPALPLALSSFKLLLFSREFSNVGLADGLVVSAGALLCPAVARDVVDVFVAGVDAGLEMAPL